MHWRKQAVASLRAGLPVSLPLFPRLIGTIQFFNKKIYQSDGACGNKLLTALLSWVRN